MHPYCRSLIERSSIEQFLEVTLEDYRYSEYEFVGKIRTCELELQSYDSRDSATLNFTENRDINYRQPVARRRLRLQIVDELFTQTIPDSEEDMELGQYGARPGTGVKAERKAFILIGPPASGKSGIAGKVATDFGAVILDSDFAKRKLPEFRPNAAGASLVHTESSALVWGEKTTAAIKPLVGRCMDEGYNVVAPRIGSRQKDILKLANGFREAGYGVHLTLVSIDRLEATKRALNRFAECGRYVPLSLVFDVYGNDPILTYYRLKEHHRDVFKSFGKISTAVPVGAPYEIIYSEAGNPAELFKTM